MPPERARAALEALGVEVVPFDLDQAVGAGALRPPTAAAGLSLGDRACLALARTRAAEAVTTDAAWSGLGVGVRIRVIEGGRRRR
jgi:PIN domain nuclease of toxin-antitoxin system